MLLSMRLMAFDRQTHYEAYNCFRTRVKTEIMCLVTMDVFSKFLNLKNELNGVKRA